MKRLGVALSIICLLNLSCIHKEKQKVDCCKKPIKHEEINQNNSDITLHDISSIWTTQDNQNLLFVDFKQKVIVAAMIFTNCQSACPRITADIKRIERQIPKDKLRDVAFVLITMDPLRDSPAKLSVFAKEHQLDLSRWTLLTGSESDILEIANVLNVRINKTENGNFDHSNIIHIINSRGNIIYQQAGLAQEPKECVENILALLNE